MPIFEDVTPEVILKRTLERMEGTLDTREGSFAYDMAAPIAFEIWSALMSLDELIEAFYVTENSGPYLDAHARIYAITRREGSKAACAVTLSGRDGTVIPAGTAFYTGDGLEFGLVEDVTIRDGTGTGLLRAAAVGQQYNVPAGDVSQILRTIQGVDGFHVGDADGGTDPESDEALFARLDERRKRPPTSGNADHYRQWALSVDGVGVVRVTPLWRGNGTVQVLIAGYDRKPVDAAVVDRCAAYIESQRPIGAQVTVASAQALGVRIAARVLLLPTASLAAVGDTLRKLVESYLAETAFEEYIIYANRVGALLMSIDGVLDYSRLTLNGQEGNLALDMDSVPVLEEVALT